jgi:quinol monooxygenase YgiN
MPMLSHAVYFTLKHRTPEAAATLVAACRKHLTGHPGTVAFSVGTLADYDRTIVFESRAAHDAYQVADRHEQFIAEAAPTWARVRVFDADLTEFTAS